MASKCAPPTTPSYQKLSRLNSGEENGISSEEVLAEEATDKFDEADEDDEVFRQGSTSEETGCTSPTSPTSPTGDGTPSNNRVRKRSVLKRSGDKPKGSHQKRVSFSSQSSERKRRVSNGRMTFFLEWGLGRTYSVLLNGHLGTSEIIS